MKDAQIFLPYFKQGDDLGQALLSSEGDILKALEDHSNCLQSASAMLMSIREEIEKYGVEEVEIDGDTHCIFISGPDDLIDLLVEKELVEIQDWEDEEECDECDCENCDQECEDREIPEKEE